MSLEQQHQPLLNAIFFNTGRNSSDRNTDDSLATTGDAENTAINSGQVVHLDMDAESDTVTDEDDSDNEEEMDNPSNRNNNTKKKKKTKNLPVSRKTTLSKNRMLRKRQAEKIRRDRTGEAYMKLMSVLVRVDPEFKHKLEARSQRESSLVDNVEVSMLLLSQDRLEAGSKERKFINSLFSRQELIDQAVSALERCATTTKDPPPPPSTSSSTGKTTRIGAQQIPREIITNDNDNNNNNSLNKKSVSDYHSKMQEVEEEVADILARTTSGRASSSHDNDDMMMIPPPPPPPPRQENLASMIAMNVLRCPTRTREPERMSRILDPGVFPGRLRAMSNPLMEQASFLQGSLRDSLFPTAPPTGVATRNHGLPFPQETMGIHLAGLPVESRLMSSWTRGALEEERLALLNQMRRQASSLLSGRSRPNAASQPPPPLTLSGHF